MTLVRLLLGVLRLLVRSVRPVPGHWVLEQTLWGGVAERLVLAVLPSVLNNSVCCICLLFIFFLFYFLFYFFDLEHDGAHRALGLEAVQTGLEVLYL